MCARYVGPVTTGSALADNYDPTRTSSLSRTPLRMRDTPPTFQVIIPTWYVTAPSNVANEVPQPGSTALSAAIEWAEGQPLTRIMFAGDAEASVGGGFNLVSDPITNQASNGQQIWIWIQQKNPKGIIYRDRVRGLIDFENGEMWACNIGVDLATNAISSLNAADFRKNTYGSPSPQANQFAFRPLAVVGLTSKPTIALMGASRVVGVGDNYADGSGYIGSMERSIGPNFAYIQTARGSETLTGFAEWGSRRLQLVSYCSHVLEDFGGNDLLHSGSSGSGISALQLAKYKEYFWSGLGKPRNRIFTLTIDPVTNAPANDYWTRTVSQSPVPQQAEFVNFNAWLRDPSQPLEQTTLPPLDGVTVIDTAAVQESAPGSFLWKSLPYGISSFMTYDRASVTATLASATGLNVGDYVAVTATGGGAGVYQIDAKTDSQVQLYGSTYDSTRWSGTGTLYASLCASGSEYGADVADGIHENPTGYQNIKASGVISSGLFQF